MLDSKEVRRKYNESKLTPQEAAELLENLCGINATPLSYSHAEFAVIQEASDLQIKDILNRLDKIDASDDVKAFAELHMLSRLYRHLTKNMQNYAKRMGSCIEGHAYCTTEELATIKERSKKGAATPLELLKLRHDEGVESIELGRATGDEQLGEALLDSVGDAVQALGGHILHDSDDVDVKMRAYSSSGDLDKDLDKDPEAIIVTKRQTIAECEEDTRIMCRTSYVVILDRMDDGMRTAIVQSLRKETSGSFYIDGWTERAKVDIDDYTQKMLEYLNNPRIATIMSTTCYGVSKLIIEECRRRDAKTKAEQAKANSELNSLVQESCKKEV